MPFWQKSHRPSFLLSLNCFMAKQIGYEQVFDNLTFKLMNRYFKEKLMPKYPQCLGLSLLFVEQRGDKDPILPERN